MVGLGGSRPTAPPFPTATWPVHKPSGMGLTQQLVKPRLGQPELLRDLALAANQRPLRSTSLRRCPTFRLSSRKRTAQSSIAFSFRISPYSSQPGTTLQKDQ